MPAKKTTEEILKSENTNATEDSINLDRNVTISSNAGWNTSFSRLTTIGDVLIPPYGTTRLTANEIIAQVQNGRPLFTGVDGAGSHATYYIRDAALRRYLGFDSEDGKEQVYLTEKVVKSLFDIKSQKIFETKFTEAVRTRAEKRFAIQCIKDLNINDYNKIRFAENYTGFQVR